MNLLPKQLKGHYEVPWGYVLNRIKEMMMMMMMIKKEEEEKEDDVR